MVIQKAQTNKFLMIKNFLIVFIGGGVGSAFRYLTSILTNKYFPSNFPTATFLVNAIGCLIIGIVAGMYLKSSMTNPDTKLLLITGFCGGFTTFSAFAYENLNLIRSDHLPLAIFYTCLSVIAGIGFVWVGLTVTK